MIDTDPFVGRHTELQRLRSAFDAARNGRGGVALLSGEPGIGKTRLARELESYAVAHGARVLWGRAYEAEGAPAYWPWLQALGPVLETAEIDELRRWLGSGAIELSRLVPLLNDRLQDLDEPEPVPDPRAAQFRLFQATTDLLARIANDAPLVIVLDDLQWADPSTTRLLAHASTELATASVLLVGTYRDLELGRQHPLERALADISRAERFQAIELRGLSELDVGAYLRAATELELPPGAVNSIHRETDGNAFYLREVVALMFREGTLASGDVALPPSVRAVIGRRLSALSETTNQLLRTAAVVGREFAEPLLVRLEDGTPNELTDSLEAARAAGVIEELDRPGAYRFRHALIQETLLDELRTSQRVRLHGRIAEALEASATSASPQLAGELATHYGEASTLGAHYSGKAIHYTRLAGLEADRQFAWGEAARLHERAAALFEESPELAQDFDRAELYASLAHAADGAQRYRLSWRAIMIAADEYRARGDGVSIARLCPESVSLWSPGNRVASLLLEASDLIGDGDGVDVGLLVSLTAVLFDQTVRPFVSDDQADELLARLARRTTEQPATEAERQDRIRIDALAALRRGDLTDGIAGFKRYPPNASLGWQLAGGLDHARTEAQRGLESPDPIARSLEVSNLLAVAALRADREEFDGLVQAHAPADLYLVDLNRALGAAVRGDIEHALALLPDPADAARVLHVQAQSRGGRCAVLWLAGRRDAAAAEFAASLDASEAAGYRSLRAGAALTPADIVLLGAVPGQFGPAAAHLADEQERDALRVIIRSQPGIAAGRMLWWPWCAQRVYGDWALTLDMLEDAARLYTDALDWCERERCPIEAALCHHGLAEVAVAAGDLPKALTRLEAASALFERYDARLYLERSRTRIDELRAARSAAPVLPAGLTEREVEVLRLITDGYSNRQIGEQLFIATPTVASHVRSILAKTDTQNRTQATSWAERNNLSSASAHEPSTEE